MGYNICIICINYLRNMKKTIYDVCEKRNRNICDIMTELNIKVRQNTIHNINVYLN